MNEAEQVKAAFAAKGFTLIASEGRFQYVDPESGDVASVSHAANGEDDWQLPEKFSQSVDMQLFSVDGQWLDTMNFESVTNFLEGWGFES